MKIFEKEMAMPKWKFYLLKTIETILSKHFWLAFLKGFIYVILAFMTIATLWIAMALFGEDELKTKGKSLDNKVKQSTPYQKAK